MFFSLRPAKAMPLHCAQSAISPEEAPGGVVSKGTLVVCKVSLVGQWVEVRTCAVFRFVFVDY